MPGEEERQASLELLASKKDIIEKVLGQRLFEERENEKALLKKAEAEFIQVLKDQSAELTEEEQNVLDAACNEALEAEIKKRVVLKEARPMGFTEIHAAYLEKLLDRQEEDLQSQQENDRLKADGHRYRLQRERDRKLKEMKEAMDRSKCNRPDCPKHGKK